MEPQQQQQNEDGSNKSSSSFQCRQSTTRWTPTTEQIRILKDLYYNNGVRSPSAEQIQKISAKLRQYGKIEGKNVFYWFQNHKARERQKKRLTTTTENIIPMQRPLWRPEDQPIFNKSPSFNSSGAVPSPSAASSVHGLNGLNQFGNYGYGSLAMEKSFRDCSISPGANGGSMVHNFMWGGGVHQDHPYPFLDKKRGYDFDVLEDEQHDQLELDDEVPELETLPLFPMHDDDDDQENVSRGFCNNMKKQSETENYYYDTTNMGYCSRASLELTLNSYGGCSSSNAP